ncbi:hypothetical protein JOC34_003595 [Virgibacillus halotolerans]|uniref:hypothetical protein n=1 Tax=Virgibacillus halotolerans TaxID=1071053 RepID=UPI00196153D4|nr:hypothetical protein [Virgibacillus halotolerans]MBM7601174.1 hypothetical protein [Virgibacillus halotolerans]
MKHPYEKFIKMELIFILCAVLFGLVALIQGYLFLILMSLYIITISLFFDALIHWQLHRTLDAGKQILRAMMLIFLITFLVFHL